MGNTQRFVCKRDEFEAAIKSFGDVVMPKTPYSERRPSVSSIASSVDLLSPLTPLSASASGLGAVAMMSSSSGAAAAAAAAATVTSQPAFSPGKHELFLFVCFPLP